MQNLRKFFSTSFAVLGAFVFVGNAYSAEGTARSGYDVRGLNRAGATQMTASQRMPTMPILPGNSVGNLSPNLPTGDSSSGGNPDNPDNPDEPDNPSETECPDGGVKNSDYTIDNCMTDILSCVNNGALPGGLNDLFNEDLRNAIVNGMGLCSAQVERCITEVRRDCKNIYRSSADVWIDFNARKVQPEYYNFVLRKTGLTPNQAENTCWLLDKNAYGSSFNAVSNSGTVTSEYNNFVGAYNSQNGNVLIKTQPQGVQVNDDNLGVDGQRGHYARWDPTTAECWLRVAAYNKDTHIKNSWLFGAAGDDQPAEVWKQAGDTFTCNKDLFGFSLMNKTSTAAVVGIGGGTLVGAGVGAIVGHGARPFDCSIKSHREMLTEELRTDGNFGTISEYLETRISPNVDVMDEGHCAEVVELYNKYNQLKSALQLCNTVEVVSEDVEIISTSAINCSGFAVLDDCFTALDITKSCVGKGFTDVQQCVDFLNQQAVADADAAITGNTDTLCSFEPLNLARAKGTSIYCSSTTDMSCKSAVEIQVDMERLDKVFTYNISDLLQNGEESNMWKSVGIGAGVGAGAGGLATAITAFVERSNINCRVGDGLAQVGFGKSYSIGSLKDFYVKWNLHLPDTISPTATVDDCDSWKRACATLTDLNQCKAAQVNYKPEGAATTTLVPTACTVSGSACIENYPVAKSYGACE